MEAPIMNESQRREQLNRLIIENMNESGAVVGTDLQAMADEIFEWSQEIAREARLDENDIWLAHSNSRKLNDNEPAIRTVDFRDRIAELTQQPAEGER